MTGLVDKNEIGDVLEEERQARVELAAAYRLAYHYGYTYMVYNHITARVPGEGHQFLINQYGLRYDEMTASNLIKLNLDGDITEGEGPVNRAGYVIHSAVHGAREDVQCVMHTHTIAGMAVSALEEGLLPLSQDAMGFYNRIAYHDYEGIALDIDERERLVTDLGHHDAMILRNHGLLTVGRTIGETFARMHNLERACQSQIQAMATGRELRVPPPEVCELAASQLEGARSGGSAWKALVRWLDDHDSSYRD